MLYAGKMLTEQQAKERIGVCYDLDAEAVFHSYAVPGGKGALVVPYEQCAEFASRTRLLDGRILFWNLAFLKRARAALDGAGLISALGSRTANPLHLGERA